MPDGKPAPSHHWPIPQWAAGRGAAGRGAANRAVAVWALSRLSYCGRPQVYRTLFQKAREYVLPVLKRRIRRILALISLLALATVIAWVWCGLGEYFLLGSLANEFPQPPDTYRVRSWPSGYRSGGGDMPSPLPPNTWSMSATHLAPEGTTKYEIMDFYIANMPPGWRWCSLQDDAGYHSGITFEKETKRVSVGVHGLSRHRRLGPSYTVSVRRDNRPGHCERATERATGLGLKPIPEGSPGSRPLHWAQQHVPFLIQVPEHLPEEYWMKVDARLLDGWPYGDGVRGVELVFRNTVGPERDLESMFARQFLAEEASAHARAYSGNLEHEETVALGDLLVKVQEGVEEKLVGERAWVRAVWEGDFQGKSIVYVVDSGASREDTLRMVEQFGARK